MKTTDGWAFPLPGRRTKAHYFHDGSALCGRWEWRTTAVLNNPVGKCSDCFVKHIRFQLLGHPEKRTAPKKGGRP